MIPESLNYTTFRGFDCSESSVWIKGNEDGKLHRIDTLLTLIMLWITDRTGSFAWISLHLFLEGTQNAHCLSLIQSGAPVKPLKMAVLISERSIDEEQFVLLLRFEVPVVTRTCSVLYSHGRGYGGCFPLCTFFFLLICKVLLD